MPLIEGFGDEVTFFLCVILVAIVIILAWMSTQVDSSFLVPIIILDRERFSALIQRLRGLAERRTTTVEGQNLSSEGDSQVHDSHESVNDNASNGNGQVADDENGSAMLPQSQKTASSQSCQAEDPLESVAAADNAVHETDLADSVSTRRADERNDDRLHTSLNEDCPTTVDNEESSTRTSIPEGHVHVRLQYVDGRQRMVHADPNDTLRDFKRNHFSAELASQSVVRFIKSGQELRDDDSTLRSYGIGDGSVIHCLITQARADPVLPSVESHRFDIGFLMFPLFGFLLTLLWYARITHRSYFSGASTCSLVAISFLYFVALIGSFRSNRMNHLHHE